MQIKHIFLSFMLLLSVSGYAQRGIEIQISAKKIEVEEPLQITFSIINHDVKGMLKTNFDPFVLVGGPSISSSSSISIINGRQSMSSTKSFTIALITKKLGKVYVPKIGFQLTDGTKIESNPIEIEVVKKGTLPRQQRQPDPNDPFAAFMDPNYDPFSGFPPMGMGGQQAPPQSNQSGIYPDASKLDLKRDIFARIHVNKNKVYVGEQINASIKIYTALNSKGFEAEKLPNFNGFWAQDIPLPEKLEMKQELINGKPFVSVEIKKMILFPTKAGTLEISPLKMKTIALVPVAVKPQRNQRQPRDLMEAILMSMGASMNTMGGVEFKEIPYSFSSGTEKITVLPLPANAPESFTGGVGTYTMNAFCNKKELKTDDALNFKLEIQGTGNLPLTEAPKAEWSEEFEVYDPLLKENYTKIPSFSGLKSWEYTIIPHQPGSYKTPPVEFTYFDLNQKKYVTLTAPSTPIQISGSPTKAKERGKHFGAINFSKQKIKPAESYHSIVNIGNGWVYGLGIFPLFLAFIIGYLPKYEKKEERFISGKKISELVTRQMKQAEVHLKANEKQPFYQEITRAYWNYFSHKFKMETSELTRQNIAEKLSEQKIDSSLITKMIHLIDKSEMGLYTSYGSQAMQELYDESLEILNDIDRQLD